MGHGPAPGRADIWQIGRDLRLCRALLHPAQGVCLARNQLREVGGMPALHHLALALLGQTSQGIGADRFEHAEAWLAFSPDGRQILTSSSDSTVRLWGTLSTVEPIMLIGHTAVVRATAVSPGGERLLTGSDDTTARIWDASTGQPLHELRGHINRISSAAFSPDGRYAMTSDGQTGGVENSRLRVWEVGSGALLHAIDLGYATGSAVFTSDGQRIASESNGVIFWWETATGREHHQIDLNQLDTFALAPDGTARLWHLDDGDLIRVACAALSRDLTTEERSQFSITDTAATCQDS